MVRCLTLSDSPYMFALRRGTKEDVVLVMKDILGSNSPIGPESDLLGMKLLPGPASESRGSHCFPAGVSHRRRVGSLSSLLWGAAILVGTFALSGRSPSTLLEVRFAPEVSPVTVTPRCTPSNRVFLHAGTLPRAPQCLRPG